MKKPLKITLWVVGVLLALVAILVFLVLPNYFASTEAELKALENTNVDSLMNLEVPDVPDVPDVPEVIPETTDSLPASTQQASL